MKSLLFFIFLLITSLAYSGSHPLQLRHDEFALMNYEDQKTYVIKLMELTAQLEGQYQKEVALHGRESSQAKEIVFWLKKLNSLLIDESYAAAPQPKDFDYYAKNFIGRRNASKTFGKKTCIFAGWISEVKEVKDVNGRTICQHPKNLKDWGYPDPQSVSDECSKLSQPILCNPSIFGFKTNSDRKLFCVESKDGALNSSHECMNKALHDKEGQDKVNERIGLIAGILSNNKSYYDNIHQYVSKICLCGEKSQFNQKYKSLITPHQTCLGLVKMIARTAKECEIPNNPLKENPFFKDLLEKASFKPPTSKSHKDPYQEFVNFKTDHKQDIDTFCEGGVTPKPNPPAPAEKSCTAECVLKDKNNYNCTITPSGFTNNTPLKGVEYVIADPKTPGSITKKQSDFGEGGADGIKEILCPVKITKTDDNLPKCTGTCTTADDKTTCTFNVTKIDGAGPITKVINREDVKDNTIKMRRSDFNINDIEGDEEISCPVDAGNGPKPPIPPVTDLGDFEIKKHCLEKQTTCTLTINPLKSLQLKDWKINWKVKDSDQGKPENTLTVERKAEDYKVSATLTRDNKTLGPNYEIIPALEKSPNPKENPKDDPKVEPKVDPKVDQNNPTPPPPPQMRFMPQFNFSTQGKR